MRSPIRQTPAVLLVLVLVVSVLSIDGARSGDAASTAAIRLVGDNVQTVLADGRFFVQASGETIEAASGSVVFEEFPLQAVTEDGRFGYSASTDDGGDHEVAIFRIGTGEITRRSLEIIGPGADERVISRVSAADPSGRYITVGAFIQGNSSPREHLVDLDATALVLDTDDALATDSSPSSVTSISADARLIGLVEAGIGGQNSDRYSDFVTTDSLYRTVERPIDASFASRWPWVASENRNWVVFFPAGPPRTLTATSLVRRNLITGVTQTVPTADFEAVSRIDVADDGRVAWTEAVGDGDQLFTWDGQGVRSQVTLREDGSQPDGEVDFFAMDSDGTSILFSSDARDLTAEEPPPAVTFAPNPAFVAVLAPSGAATPVTVDSVLANSRVCSRAPAAQNSSAIVNVTPVRADGVGFVTAHGADDGPGDTSSANYRIGSIDPNVAVATLGISRNVCVTNGPTASTQVVVDLILLAPEGVFTQPSRAGAVRLVDTRSDGGRLDRSDTICLPSVGADAGDHVGLNVTPVRADGRGFATAHAGGADVGGTSSVNYDVGSVDPNVAFVLVGSEGEVCVTNGPTAAVDVVVDQVVVVPAGGMESATGDGAVRLVDTRSGRGGGRLAPSDRRCVAVVGAVPGEFVGANITAVRAQSIGFVTFHSSDDAPGGTSSANYQPGAIDPNLAFARVGADGQVCVSNGDTSDVDLIVDQLIVAEADTFTLPSDDGAVRLIDTRAD